MKAIILARVSTEEQRTEGESIPAQLENIGTILFGTLFGTTSKSAGFR